MNFACGAAYFAASAQCPGLRRFITPSFTRALEAARKMLTHDAAMFSEFTGANPFFPDALRDMQALLSEAGRGRLEDVSRLAASWYGGPGSLR